MPSAWKEPGNPLRPRFPASAPSINVTRKCLVAGGKSATTLQAVNKISANNSICSCLRLGPTSWNGFSLSTLAANVHSMFHLFGTRNRESLVLRALLKRPFSGFVRFVKNKDDRRMAVDCTRSLMHRSAPNLLVRMWIEKPYQQLWYRTHTLLTQ